ncbi:hypothetical protein [Christiangramia aestuarii]|uniref:Uncharacterized protein n=1 Tax=Christiangramia aestuarii TaxID=1028746 RepID=A0A7K1LRM7_9FLAO|nr:hypothetical protein [Christiangramia aestuarii]MUP43462.1 hypothetical protein [Christiangramia aestuarii]
MKLIVLFISFLVLSLSSFPCCFLGEIGENANCNEDHNNTEDDHSGDGACSPFFNCGSCTGFAIKENLEIAFVKDELPGTNFTSYLDSFKSVCQNPDFKPPKRMTI